MPDLDPGRIEKLATWLDLYHREDIDELAQAYPSRKTLDVSWETLWTAERAIAEDYCIAPDKIHPELEAAVAELDVPTADVLDDITVRVGSFPDDRTIPPSDARREERGGEYVAVEGILERVTTTKQFPTKVCWECEKCQRTHYVPQSPLDEDLSEPVVCEVPDGQNHHGPYNVNHDDSTWTDYAKVRIEARPDSDGSGKITGYVTGDLIDAGGEDGLLGRVGEPVVASGVVKRKQQSGRNESSLLFDPHLEVQAVDFERDEETVDVAAHREAFEELAAREDAVDLFAESIVPQLYTTDGWEAGLEFAVAYLFGAPRIDIPRGPTYRGDLHFMIISDYGVGKSTFAEQVANFSPNAINKSTTSLSSGVGLTAAAVQDDFGDGAWTLKPGLLVRANGGHLILDEIDKGEVDLTGMNDALEGQQVVDAEKAGQSATYESRCGVLTMGNPMEGRFDPNQPIGQQLGIPESFLSRMDGIVTMNDVAEVEKDTAVAQKYGEAYTEAQQYQHGDREELEVLDRPVPVDVGQAWVKHARESVTPILHYEQFETLVEWYAEEVRQLNNEFASGDEGRDMPVPATARELGAAVKMAIAFARVRLQNEVSEQNIERAKSLGRRLVKQNWTGDGFDVTKNVASGGASQKDRIARVEEIIANADGITRDQLRARADEAGIDPDQAIHEMEQLKQRGEVYEPKMGEFKLT